MVLDDAKDALQNKQYIEHIKQARNAGLTFIVLGVGDNLDVVPFLHSHDMQEAGITDASKIVLCPDCIKLTTTARDYGESWPGEAREDVELEQIALRRARLLLVRLGPRPRGLAVSYLSGFGRFQRGQPALSRVEGFTSIRCRKIKTSPGGGLFSCFFVSVRR